MVSMSLGEAFIEVRADLRPFGRDLRRSVRPLVEAFEREFNNAVGRTVLANSEETGRRSGDRISRGINKSLTEQFKKKNAFLAVTASLAGALDDGISALPTEVKAAIVLGIIAALPIISGFLTGAVVAGLGAGIAGIGVLLGAQFQQVQDRGVEFGRNIRRELVDSARDFVPAIFQAMDMIETRIRQLRPAFDEIFNVSSSFLEPLTEGGLDFLEEIINSIRDSIGDIKPFVDELGAGFTLLGNAIGRSMKILVSTGKDGQVALRDLFALVGSAIVAFSLLLKVLTHLYATTRQVILTVADLAGAFSPLLQLLAFLIRKIDEHANHNKAFINTNTDAVQSFDGLIAATTGETQALEDYKNALDDAAESARSNLQLNLDWEESLDRISEALKENGKTLDIHTEKGRANITEFMKGLQIAEERAILRVQRGEATSEQAALQYQAEIAQLRQLATQAGLSGSAFDTLFNEIILTSQAKISSAEIGIPALNGDLSAGADAAKRLLEMLQLIMHLQRTIGAGAIAGVRGFADGGVLNFPETIRAAESGPEVIIPLTKPARAAQLLAQTGLSSMLSGGGPSQVMVFIGNEQLDSRMVRVTERNNRAQAMALSHGGRQL
jgi:hypothetical protein